MSDSIRLATFDQYRSLLFSIAYRMLGTVADAEDMLQDTFLRWQETAVDEIRSPRAFLVTIISRLCINHSESARVRREEYFGEWLPEPLVSNVGSDPLAIIKVDESLSMAFLLLLERLTAVERAVFLLREVFEYEYSEIAAILELTEANCRQILRRARQHISAGRPRFRTSEQEQKDLVQRFLSATTKGDMDGLIALLAEDVVLHGDGGGKAIAVREAIHGAKNVAGAILTTVRERLPKNLVPLLVRVNGEAGLVAYRDGKPFSVITLEAAEGRIRGIYIVSNPEKLAHIPDLK